MKLYYSKGACSLASRIVLEEMGLPYEAIAVDFSKELSPEFLKLNPMGSVPVLEMENGETLTEGSAILQYLADRKSATGFAPAAGTPERYRLQEWLNFIATEIHKGFSPLFSIEAISKNPATGEELRTFFVKDLGRKFDVLANKLGTSPFLMASGYSVADAYLFTVLNWSSAVKMDLSRWPTLPAYMDRVKARPATIRALQAEHLM